MSLPGPEELTRVFTAAPASIVEDDNPGTFFQVVAAVGPQVGLFSLSAAGIKLGYRRFIGMKRAAFQQ